MSTHVICLNPALDHIIKTNGFEKKRTNYYQSDYLQIGGKGINVSMILNRLGSDFTLITVLGQENHYLFEKELNKNYINFVSLLNEGTTRVNYKIKNLSIGEETELNGEGFILSEQNFWELKTYLHKCVKENNFVILTGSAPKQANNEIYFELAQIASRLGAKVVLDTSKHYMIEALKAKPFLIKPNIEELCEILNVRLKESFSFTELLCLIENIKTIGARNILLSQGSKGSIYFGEDGVIIKVSSAQGELVNSVGSGDSMVAGFVHALSQNQDIEECLIIGAAAGAATAFSEGLGEKEMILKLKSQIQTERVI